MGPSRPASQLHTANASLHCPLNPLLSLSESLFTHPHPVQAELHKAERIASELMGATWHPEISGMAKSLKRPDADLPSYMRLSAQRTSKTQVGWGWRRQVLSKRCVPSPKLKLQAEPVRHSLNGPDADLPPYTIPSQRGPATHMIHYLLSGLRLSGQQCLLHSFSKQAAIPHFRIV